MKKSASLILPLLICCAACNDVQDKKATPQATANTASKKETTATVLKEDDLLHARGQYCIIKKVHPEEGVVYIDADYIQFFTGNEAVKEAKKRGDAEKQVNDKGDTVYTVPDDIYVVNDNKKIRQLPLAGDAELLLLHTENGRPAWVKGSIDELRKRSQDVIFILTVRDGVITGIKQQYLP